MRRTAALVAISSMFLAVLASHAPAAPPKSPPIPPKDWNGTIQVFVAARMFSTYFEENGCDWGGQDQLNGVDGFVWDMTGYGGLPGTMVWTTDSPATPDVVGMFFLDADCNRIPGVYWTSGRSDMGKVLPIVIPSTAKWAVVGPAGGVTNDVEISVHSDGYTPPKPKKKKKK
jgi:hypothetical protein